MADNNHQDFDLTTYFLRWQDGRLSPSEKKKLDAWLTSEENTQVWDALQQTWRVANPLPAPKGSGLESQWKRLANSLPAEQPGKARTTMPRKHGIWDRISWPSLRPGLAVAAALALFLVIYLNRPFQSPQLEKIVAPAGQIIEITLPDESRVQLNAGSSLEYPAAFGSEIRNVWLKGEGYFIVTTSEVPFVVETTQARTTVLGTEFNVRTWDATTQVYVNSGRVAVHSNNAVQAAEVEVLPGQLAVCDNGPITVQPTEPGPLLSWRQGGLVFSNRPLASALADMERHFAVTVTASPNLLQLSITASFRDETFQTVLETLASTLDATIIKTGSSYHLSEK